MDSAGKGDSNAALNALAEADEKRAGAVGNVADIAQEEEEDMFEARRCCTGCEAVWQGE